MYRYRHTFLFFFLGQQTCLYVRHKNAFFTFLRLTLFFIRDLFKKRVIYLFIHSTASGWSVLAFCIQVKSNVLVQGCEVSRLVRTQALLCRAWRYIPEVEQFVECTVLLQLRDLLKSFNDECFPVNVQRCLNAHLQTCMLHLPGKHSQIVLSLVVCSVLSCRQW